MSSLPTVIVKKGGFFSALVYGIFGLATTTVVCATGLGLFGLHQAGRVLEMGAGAIADLPEWLDRSVADYRDSLEVTAKAIPGRGGHGSGRVLVSVHNKGVETVSALALRIVLRDADGNPLREVRTYAATPLMLPGVEEWRGPLLPGHETEYSERVGVDSAEVSDVKIEIADIRLATVKHGRTVTTANAGRD